MINMYEVSETNKMIEQENLDVRTITMGISLLDCIDPSAEKTAENIYNKIVKYGKNLVEYADEISKSITKLISKKLKSKLWFYEKECLVYVKDNLKNILK